ncbi:hypothetical protein C0J52_01026 [Blattella germanica]|nr:hypothetical protein C0J52_01026 [Blattella germanica]
MCHVDLPLPAAVRISAVSVVVCRWCGKIGDLTESQRSMIVGARLVGASAATVANIVGVSKGTVSNVMRAYSVWRTPSQTLLSLSDRIVFQPLFCFADVVCPCIEYALMTLDTVPFDTPMTFATVAAEAPTRRAPTIMPLWDSVRSHTLLHHLHTRTLTAEILTAAGKGRST